MAALPDRAAQLCAAARAATGRIVVLTGAGISAESGIPTFRGPEGYWRVGSENFRPEELATRAAFARMPAAAWGWYLYRRAVCRRAEPNAAHRALVALERALGDRCLLVTQNVDGLHARAGHAAERLFEVHGNLHRVRCAAGCSPPRAHDDELLRDWPRDREPATAAELAALHCACGAWLRPHVLWFDEFYDEANYRYDSSLRAVDGAALLLVIGTSGATNLPTRMVEHAFVQRQPLLVVNLDESPYSELAQASPHGAFLQGRATDFVPALARALGGIDDVDLR